jgi:hypothetical protein
MTAALAVLGVAIVVALVLLAARGRGHRRSRRALPAELPEGWLDLGVLPVPYGRHRALPRMLSAYLDPAATRFANAVRHARTCLVLDAVPHGRGVVFVHAGPCAPDAPWAASNLALALAQLGPVLLVHDPEGPALDDTEATDAAAPRDGGAARTWPQGMIDLLRCEAGSLPDAATVDGEWARYEWVVVQGECAAALAGAGTLQRDGLVHVSLYAGAEQLRDVVAGAAADAGSGEHARAVLGVAEE